MTGDRETDNMTNIDYHSDVLDHGYVMLVEHWGDDSKIIESARMSTGKGFLGWGSDLFCVACDGHGTVLPTIADRSDVKCTLCRGTGRKQGDEKLLRYLYTHKHLSPFEMCGATFEVQAPIFVFREWHRHRTQSYNELSARYTPLPDLNYRPDVANIIERVANAGTNKQAQGSGPKHVQTDVDYWETVERWLKEVDEAYRTVENVYHDGLSLGIPKEVARIVVPVGRYSRMRASANLRNWLQFLTLRMSESAQWEIRQYANAVCQCLSQLFPRTVELFTESIEGDR